jgi:diguanylate cyclase (GGDEF)-like protein/PAS domain S-box-containing protein
MLVSLSVVIAIFSSYSALLVSRHVSSGAISRNSHLWIAGGGLSFGIGIWAMHFVGMLAFNLPCSSSYDAGITVLSVIPGILSCTLALKIISRREISHAQLVISGLLLGSGIAAMHYTGMAAMRFNGMIRYDIGLFLISIVVVVTLATLALWIKFRMQSLPVRWGGWVTLASAVMMGLAVFAMHYTAMASAYFIRDDGMPKIDSGMAPSVLATIVLTATSLIVVVTILAAYVEKPNLSALGRFYKLIGLSIVCWGIVAWSIADYYYRHFSDDLYQRELQSGTQQAESIVSNINDNIELLKGISSMYSHDEDMQRGLRRAGEHAMPSGMTVEERKQRWTHDSELAKLDKILGIEAQQLGVDLIYIVNAAGDCIAASNADQPGSAVGTNYADRKYFALVKSGRSAHQYAMGRTTHVAGLYYVTPILDAGRFIGAVVIKRDVQKLARWTNQANAFMTDANGVIILTEDKSIEFRTIPDAAIARLSLQEKQLQYARSEFDPLKIVPWKGGRFPSVVLINEQTTPTLLVSKRLSDDGMDIYVPHRLDELVRLGSEKSGLFLLLFVAGSLLITAISVVVIYLRDSKKAAADLRLAASAFESQEGMMITDCNSVILRVNRAFTEITGYTAEEIIGQTPRILSSGRHDAAFFAAMWESIGSTGFWDGEILNRRKNGELYPERLTITQVRDESGSVTNYVAALSDITQRKKAEDEIQNLAFFDPLTGLPNRRLLMDRLKHALGVSVRSNQHGALMFIDLDNFKNLNDSRGHAIGDLLIQEVARRLAASIREGDTAARLGGDEFVVILENLSASKMEAASRAEVIGEKIESELRKPYVLDSKEYRSTCSIGVTLFNDHEAFIDELFKQADIAMYQAKKAGRNTLRFFDPKMQDAINVRIGLEAELRNALERQQFQLYYQIQINHAHQVLGAETLIRWVHPERGMVSPAQFIPLAEETGMIISIGTWVLETACAQIKAWQQNAFTRDLVLAVNVSAKQFHQDDFVNQVRAAVQHHSINPALLKLELTEGMLVSDIDDTIATMMSLKEFGIQFSLDDFGTGYSSLQYLKRLPLNQLKIDQSFVREVTTNNSDAAIVGTIIAMAHTLNLDVIAEGVETEQQRQLLLDKGCAHFQGYLFGKPLPVEQFELLLEQYR